MYIFCEHFDFFSKAKSRYSDTTINAMAWRFDNTKERTVQRSVGRLRTLSEIIIMLPNLLVNHVTPRFMINRFDTFFPLLLISALFLN